VFVYVCAKNKCHDYGPPSHGIVRDINKVVSIK
jgi:hypothetical protein